MPEADAVIVHVPVELNVTTPPLALHVPVAAMDGVSPVDDPVTADTDDTTGVYVPVGNGDAGTEEVKASVCAAFAMVSVWVACELLL